MRQGGTVVLGETTEIYGAEHLLTRRARSPDVAGELLERIRWWERHAATFGATIDNNPTPGNKAGGLTTIYEKSLGAVAKAGSTPLNQVVGYAERITGRGLVHMDTPGYDPVSVTGQVAGGCTVVVFTTGSCFGFIPRAAARHGRERRSGARRRHAQRGRSRDLRRGARRRVGEANEELAGIGEEEFNPWQTGVIL